MESFFGGPEVERLPPAETRLVELRAQPDPDGKRLRVYLELTPFLKRPNIELLLTDQQGLEVSSASIIEPMGWKLELTLHIRKATSPLPSASGQSKINLDSARTTQYQLSASLTYPDLGEMDRRLITVDIDNAQNDK